MTNQLIEDFEKSQMKKNVPHVRVGDKVRISKTIVEGKKKRTQKFEGTVIKVQGKHTRLSIVVRRIMGGVGVEKSYLVHSPLVTKIEILNQSIVRRARLTYLRDRVGARANRLKVKEKQA